MFTTTQYTFVYILNILIIVAIIKDGPHSSAHNDDNADDGEDPGEDGKTDAYIGVGLRCVGVSSSTLGSGLGNG